MTAVSLWFADEDCKELDVYVEGSDLDSTMYQRWNLRCCSRFALFRKTISKLAVVCTVRTGTWFSVLLCIDFELVHWLYRTVDRLDDGFENYDDGSTPHGFRSFDFNSANIYHQVPQSDHVKECWVVKDL